MLINMFDTSIATDNLGDEIIMDAVWDAVREVYPAAEFVLTPTHRMARPAELWRGRRATLSLVGGTNILKSHMFVRGNWRITPLDPLIWRNVVLFGVGWQQYGGAADLPTRLFLRRVLSSTLLHSVRDQYTFDKLQAVVPNVLYTGCPTMWGLTEQACRRVPVRKARDAVFCVTYYHPDPAADRAVFDLLRQNYEKIYIFAQQAEDEAYIAGLGLTGFTYIDRSVAAYNALLDENDIDYVGSRLHGGIRALQRGRRAAIIPVDNRATEIARSSQLVVRPRTDIAGIAHWIANPEPVRLVMPWDGIRLWKDQFHHQVALETLSPAMRRAGEAIPA